MSTFTVKLSVALATTDGTYLELYTPSYPIVGAFAHFSTPNEEYFVFTASDSDVSQTGNPSVHQQNGAATGVLEVYETPSGGSAFLRGKYYIFECFVNLRVGAALDDRFRLRCTKAGEYVSAKF